MTGIPFDAISAAALANASRLLADWFPHGRIRGREFKEGNIAGEPGESLSINLSTGVWKDFASNGVSGADLIDLRAAIGHSGDKGSAARELAQSLGIIVNGVDRFPRKSPPSQAKADDWTPMVPPPTGTKPPPQSTLDRFDAYFEYTDTADRVTHYVGRIEGTPKVFVPLTSGTLNGVQGWHRRRPANPLALYGLNRLSAFPDAEVLLCEGEKAADAAQTLFPDRPCLSWYGGTGSVEYADLAPLQGRQVTIWPDADKPGRDAAAKLAAKLPLARTLRVDDLPDKFDAGDLTAEDPEAWLSARLLREPNDDFQHPHPLLSLPAFIERFTAPDFIIDGIVQRGRLYSLTAKSGHGKTSVGLLFACSVATGRAIGKVEIEQGAVVFLAGENPDDLCARSIAACQEYGLDPNTTPIRIMPGHFGMTHDDAVNVRNAIDAAGMPTALIIADSLSAYFPGEDDNHNVAMGEYARDLRILNGCIGNPAIVILSHPVKNAAKDNMLPRGGGQFLNEVDGNLTLWSETQGEATTLHWQGKIRGPDFSPVNFALKPVKLAGVIDKKGRPFFSIVATVQTDEQAETADKRAANEQTNVLEWLRRDPGISLAAIADKLNWTAKDGAPDKSKVHRIIERLAKRKPALAERGIKGKWKVTKDGVKELEGS